MRVALVLGCLLLATTARANDLIVRQRSSTGMPMPVEETVYLVGDKIVTDSAGTRTIVDVDKQSITSIDKAKRAYTVVTFAELQAQMDTLRKALDSLPPEARKQMAALFDENAEPVRLAPTGKTETIAGHPAKEYAISGGPYRGSIWTTDEIAKPVAFQKWKKLEKTRGGPARQLGEAMEKLDGFPLRTRIEAQAPGGKPVVLSNDVLEVREGPPPAGALVVPPGFTQQAAGGLPSSPGE